MGGLAILAAMAGVTLAAPGPYNDNWPPTRFQGNRAGIIVDIASQQEIDSRCGPTPPPGKRYLACSWTEGLFTLEQHIMMSNPCLAPAYEDWARNFCHELGHTNGWGGNHEL